jgi:hypothetical protein
VTDAGLGSVFSSAAYASEQSRMNIAAIFMTASPWA